MACAITDKIRTIIRTEYIGNSLNVINDNFQTLRDEICIQDSLLTNISLSAETLDTKVTSLSTVTVPGAAKVRVKFDGTKDTNNRDSTLATERRLYKSLNVQSVYRKKIGDYRIYFITPFDNNAYIVTGTCSESDNTKVSQIIPYSFSTEFVDVRISREFDPRHVSIVIF